MKAMFFNLAEELSLYSIFSAVSPKGKIGRNLGFNCRQTDLAAILLFLPYAEVAELVYALP